MNSDRIATLRARATLLLQQAIQLVKRIPVKALTILGLFLAAALLMAVYTAITTRDASLHMALQHGFRSARVSVWVDSDLAFSGKITGTAKKKFGLFPTDSPQGTLSQIIPVSSGQHNVRVRVEPEGSSTQEDNISGTFLHNAERDLYVSTQWDFAKLAGNGWRTHNLPQALAGYLATLPPSS